MGGPWEPKQTGWAGQWDRHRWTMPGEAKAKEIASQEPPRRLKSLDEFEPLPWHKVSKAKRFHQTSLAAATLLASAAVIGVAAGALL